MLKETEAAKPTVGRNGALPLARFGLGVGRVEFWISTRVENSAIFLNDFSLDLGGKSHYLRAKTDLLWGA